MDLHSFPGRPQTIEVEHGKGALAVAVEPIVAALGQKEDGARHRDKFLSLIAVGDLPAETQGHAVVFSFLHFHLPPQL